MPGVASIGQNNRIVVGVLAIFLGALGIHKFLLGYTQEGVIMLAITLATVFFFHIGGGIMAIVGFVEGIIYLTKTDQGFYLTYIASKKPWF